MFTLGDPTCCWLTDRQHTSLWLVAALTFVVGDTVTTAVGLRSGTPEANPLAASLLEAYGVAGMVAVETGVFGALYGLYFVFDRVSRYTVDDEAALFVAALGLVVTGWNVSVLVLA